MKKIKVIEFTIDQEELSKYLGVYGITRNDALPIPLQSKIPSGQNPKRQIEVLTQLSLEANLNRVKADLACARGYLIELLAYWYFTSKKQKAKWRLISKEIGDIDVLSIDNNGTLNVVSCMAVLEEEKIKKMAAYVEGITNHKIILPTELACFKEIRKVVFTTIEPELKKRDQITSREIFLLSLERLFAEDPVFHGIKKVELNRLLLSAKVDKRMFEDWNGIIDF